jgi:putative membrane protein
MGAADAVPGVSGGTIALVLGVYQRLIDSIATCLKILVHIRTPEGRARLGRALRFLVPLFVGILAAYWVGTRLLVGPSDAKGLLRRADTAPLCYAFFLGLVAASLREPWRRITKPDARCLVAALVACLLTAWAVGLDHTTRAPETWMLLYGGALAVAVMLLPGISGSLMLLVIGQYTTITTAVHDLTGAGARGPPLERVGVFLGGMLLGLALFVPLLRHLLRTRKDLTLAILTGLMAGSVRALWPWKSHYDLKDVDRGRMVNVEIGPNWPWVLLFVLLGVLAVWLLRRLEGRIERAARDDSRRE